MNLLLRSTTIVCMVFCPGAMSFMNRSSPLWDWWNTRICDEQSCVWFGQHSPNGGPWVIRTSTVVGILSQTSLIGSPRSCINAHSRKAGVLMGDRKKTVLLESFWKAKWDDFPCWVVIIITRSYHPWGKGGGGGGVLIIFLGEGVPSETLTLFQTKKIWFSIPNFRPDSQNVYPYFRPNDVWQFRKLSIDFWWLRRTSWCPKQCSCKFFFSSRSMSMVITHLTLKMVSQTEQADTQLFQTRKAKSIPYSISD